MEESKSLSPVSDPGPSSPTLSEGLSIVVAVRNRSGKRVDMFLKSLRGQSFDKPYEIILVDSCSEPAHRDSLKELCETHLTRLIRIDAEHTWNKCLALNLGIRQAQYGYTMLTDIDMIFQDNFLSEVWKALETHKGKAVVHCQSRDLNEHDTKRFTNLKDYQHFKTKTTLHTKMGNGACCATQTEWFHKVRGLDERMFLWGAMDRDIGFRAEWDGLKSIWLEKTTFLHQWHTKKTALWRKDRNIYKAFMKNHELLGRYSRAFQTKKLFPDQIVRNNASWGTVECGLPVMESLQATTPRPQKRKLVKTKKEKVSRTIRKINGKTPQKLRVKIKQPEKSKSARQNFTQESVSQSATIKNKTAAIAFNTCPADYAVLEHIIPHVIKQCRFPFNKKYIFSDTSAFRGKYARHRNVDLKAYQKQLESLKKNGLIDEVIDTSQVDKNIKENIHPDLTDKSYVGSPTFSYVCSMTIPEEDYILRLDSDMAFYADPKFSWVDQGIRYLESHKDTLFFMAFPGPYISDHRKVMSVREGVKRENGVFKYKTVTTRYFLFERQRFFTHCPFKVSRSDQRFEVALSEMLRQKNLYRVCMNSEQAWHLHTNASKWATTNRNLLTDVLSNVEKQRFPKTQLGKYDIRLSDWKTFCLSQK